MHVDAIYHLRAEQRASHNSGAPARRLPRYTDTDTASTATRDVRECGRHHRGVAP